MSIPSDLLAKKMVAYYAGCFANYYYPEVGHAMVKVLRRNGIQVTVPDQACCGLPMLAKGNIKGAYGSMERNLRSFVEAVGDGHLLVTGCSSCSLFIKRDYPLLLGRQDAEKVARNTCHFSEYLLGLHQIGEFSTDFKAMHQTVFYHTPCHLRAQEIDSPTVELLRLIPGLTIKHVNDACCGMGGAYGYERANYERSKEIGGKLFAEIGENPADRVVTDCGGCKLQIEAGTGVKVDHPIILVREAYNL